MGGWFSDENEGTENEVELSTVMARLATIAERDARNAAIGSVNEIEEEYMDEDGNVTQEAYRESQDRAVLPRSDNQQVRFFAKARTYTNRFGSEEAKYKMTQEIKGEAAR